jgi:hypothetical protein
MLLRVMSISFLFEKSILAHLPLVSICKCLLSQVELVNVLKSALEKGESAFDAAVIDNFYVKTLKSALFHFKNLDFASDELIAASFNRKELKQRIDFLVQICDYLRNDDFHQLSIKKLPKRHELFARKRTDINPFIRQDISLTKKLTNKFRDGRSDSIRQVSYSSGNEAVNLTILRYSLLYLISEQIDRIKAHSFPLMGEVSNPYSLAGKKGYIANASLEELLISLSPSKGAKLIYSIVQTFGDRVEDPASLLNQLTTRLSMQPLYKYPSFLPLYAEEHKNDPQKLRELNYWKSPHIPVMLQYLSP